MAPSEVARLMAELSEMRGEQRAHNTDVLRRLDSIERAQVSIEQAQVQRVEVVAIERRVTRVEGHLAKGAWGVVATLATVIGTTLGWHRLA